jgi:hypothetical protein
MRASTILLYISYTLPLVFADNSETSVFFYVPTHVAKKNGSLLMITEGQTESTDNDWITKDFCFPSGRHDGAVRVMEGTFCDNLPKYKRYVSSPTLKPGQVYQIKYEQLEYRLDVSCINAYSSDTDFFADTQCNMTGAAAEPGAGVDAGYWVRWLVYWGLPVDSDPNDIVCLNTTISG